jgi:protein-histidine N-methyltransferase
MSFSFGFAGDDISDDEQASSVVKPSPAPAFTTSAFPVPGKPQLLPTVHQLSDLLAQLPSKIAYSLLDVTLDDGTTIQLPRRELWDVRVQLMAEEEDVAGAQSEGLGSHDVKTGVYEGGFKSWESSVDLVKVLAANKAISALEQKPFRVMEVCKIDLDVQCAISNPFHQQLGCGTALPSLAVFQWAMTSASEKKPLSLIMADYNPSVLQLVTLPNFILSWALNNSQLPALQEAFSIEGEVELGPDVLAAFQQSLVESNITLSFVSGAWSQDFVDLIYTLPSDGQPSSTLLLGAETIYSPFALQAFLETLFLILEKERDTEGSEAGAYIGAKRLYFGVGGSLDDFIDMARQKGAKVEQLRQETEGVRRGVVQCVLGRT